MEEITYRTGYQGEDLTGKGFFDDKRLFFLIFIYYYPRYEPQHCFVAVDTRTDAVVGFICGTPDTVRQRARFLKKVVPRIALRALLYTTWRYPRTLKTLLGMLKLWREIKDDESAATIQAAYPAHLHIDLHAEYQSMGVGTRLMRHFEAHMRGLNVEGIHLQTSDRNRKAVPFYHKMGFALIKETPVQSHPAFDHLSLLTFAKTLNRE
jgi:ribosomal protein S18 acetylase RimI-like enzyme